MSNLIARNDENFNPTEIVLTIEQLLHKMDYYRPYVMNLFEYLNREIVPRNMCNLTVTTYNPYNYAEFRKPNTISIALGSIINNNLSLDDESIRAIIALSLTHELFHANQETSMAKYGVDPYYAEQIEIQAEYMAEQFLLSRRDICINQFSFDPSKVFVNKTNPPELEYKQFKIKSFYINVLVDVLFRNIDAYARLDELFSRNENGLETIILGFDSLDSGNHNNSITKENSLLFSEESTIMIKKCGHFLEEHIPIFNQIINRKYRRGSAVLKYTISTKCYTGLLENLPGKRCVLIEFTTSKDKIYNPVDFLL